MDEIHKIPDNVLVTLQQDVREIKTALLGNEYNDVGIVKRQYENENQIKEVKDKLEKELVRTANKIDRIYWTAGGISFGVSLIITVVLFVLSLNRV